MLARRRGLLIKHLFRHPVYLYLLQIWCFHTTLPLPFSNCYFYLISFEYIIYPTVKDTDTAVSGHMEFI